MPDLTPHRMGFHCADRGECVPKPLAPLTFRVERHQPANPMHTRSIAADFDAPDPAIEALFGGDAT